MEDRYTSEPGTTQKQQIGDIYGDVNEDLELKTVLSQPQPKARKITPHPAGIITDLNATEIVSVIQNPEYNL